MDHKDIDRALASIDRIASILYSSSTPISVDLASMLGKDLANHVTFIQLQLNKEDDNAKARGET